tara:strand:- start:21614 stop:23572 length:1959 start_codon:yes stop_codon:yes gene_type:complete
MHTQSSSSDPSRLGTVEDVNGSSISVKLSENTPSGLLFVNGEAYRVGQVGGFVRVPSGYVDLFGVISQVGAGAAPGPPELAPQFGNRWLRVELVGEGRKGAKFERGISQYPSIGDPVHVVTESDLRTVYAPGDEDGYVAVGRIASAESIRAYLDLNRLVGRHSAVVGSTGAGKSTTIASLLAAISDSGKLPGARVVVLDLHGEYAKALGNQATVFRLNPRKETEEHKLCIPYWALAFDELVSICLGTMDDKQRSVIGDLVVTLKQEAALVAESASKTFGIATEDITVDTPVPFCLKELWFRQHYREHRMVTKKQGGSDDDVVDALVVGNDGKAEQPGDAEKLIPPKFRTYKNTGPRDQHVAAANEGANLRQQVALLHSRLRDKQLGFLFTPGDWAPDAKGSTKEDLDSLLGSWMCTKRPITVLDLSGIPSIVLDHLIGAVLRILFDAAFWGRSLPVGGRGRPLLIVLEEAHRYLGNSANISSGPGRGGAANAARRIAKEGRKYGVGLMLVSQRPSEIDTTILSQCGTMIALRLTNEADRAQIASVSSDSLKGLFAMLPILRTHEALIVGEAVNMPIRARMDLPPVGRWPDSEDPMVVVPKNTDGKRARAGGWTAAVKDEEYRPLVVAWRNQDSHAEEDSSAKGSEKLPKKKG